MSETPTFLIVGSLNRPAPYFEKANGVGLSVFAFDARTGMLSALTETRGIDNPSFLCIDAASRHIYADSEVAGWNEGTVSAYRFEPTGARLVYLNKQATLGSITSYVSLDRTAGHVLVTNYRMGDPADLPGQGVLVLPIRDDGSLAPASFSARPSGSGPDAERQEQAHPHCVLASPDNRYLIVADLGADKLLTYPFDAQRGRMAAEPVAACDLPAGSGPRHLLFDAPGMLAYLVCELSSTVAVLDFDPQTGAFSLRQSESTLPPGFDGVSHGADLQFGPGGRFLYVSNGGHDSITIFGLDGQTGALTPVDHVPAGGRTPRNLAVDPEQRFLLVANQDSDMISCFAIDPETGALSPHGTPFAVGTPLCMKFARFYGTR